MLGQGCNVSNYALLLLLLLLLLPLLLLLRSVRGRVECCGHVMYECFLQLMD